MKKFLLFVFTICFFCCFDFFIIIMKVFTDLLKCFDDSIIRTVITLLGILHPIILLYLIDLLIYRYMSNLSKTIGTVVSLVFLGTVFCIVSENSFMEFSFWLYIIWICLICLVFHIIFMLKKEKRTHQSEDGSVIDK